MVCVIFHALINTVPGSFVGVNEAMGFGDLSTINPLIYLGGIALLTLYSVYLWYRTDKEENKHD